MLIENPQTSLTRHLRLLVITANTYPLTRVDASILFGEELAGRGHTIDWILQSEQPCREGYTTRWGGGTVFVGPTDIGTSLLNRFRKHALGVVHDLRLFEALREGGYDIVKVKNKFIAGILALIAARLFRTRFVYWLSYPIAEAYLLGGRDGTGRYPFLWRIRGALSKFALYKIILPRADHIFVQSEQMRSDMAAEGVPFSKMTPVPMGIKLDSIPSVPAVAERTLIPKGERCFLYLGTLIKVRRLDFLVRVLARVHAEVPDAKLYFVGSGEYPSDEELLIKEARRLNVATQVVLIGQLPQGDALRYVREADVCVSPFYPTPILSSTSPTKLVEYMAMSKAVVANDHPEQRLVIEQSGAGYCVPYEEDAFARAVVKLLLAPEEARVMGARGRLYVTQHRAYGVIADVVERDLLRVASAPKR